MYRKKIKIYNSINGHEYYRCETGRSNENLKNGRIKSARQQEPKKQIRMSGIPVLELRK